MYLNLIGGKIKRKELEMSGGNISWPWRIIRSWGYFCNVHFSMRICLDNWVPTTQDEDSVHQYQHFPHSCIFIWFLIVKCIKCTLCSIITISDFVLFLHLKGFKFIIINIKERESHVVWVFEGFVTLSTYMLEGQLGWAYKPWTTLFQAILLFHFVPECREESWRQIEFSIFSAYGKKKFSWFFIYIISLVVSIRCGSVMIYLYQFFSKSEYVFSICIFELLLLEVIFYYVSECFYIAFGLFNLVMQILHFGSPLLIFYLNYCFCGFLITICLPIFFHSYLFSFFLASTIS